VKVLSIVVGLSLIAACGSGSKSAVTSAPSTSSSTTATTAAPTTTAAATTTIAAATTTTGASTTALSGEQAAIAAAVTLFFDFTNPDVDGKVAVLENGEKYRSMLADAVKDPLGSTLSTKVSSVEILEDSACKTAGVASPCAKVTHDLFAGPIAAFAGRQSYTIKVNGKWLVTAKSWCDLVAVEGQTCPA
jgi:hypothetical protein